MQQCGQDAHERRLAAAVRSEQAERCVGLHHEVETVERRDGAEPVPLLLGDDCGRIAVQRVDEAGRGELQAFEGSGVGAFGARREGDVVRVERVHVLAHRLDPAVADGEDAEAAVLVRVAVSRAGSARPLEGHPVVLSDHRSDCRLTEPGS